MANLPLSSAFLLLFLFLFACAPAVLAEIKTLKIVSDARPMILFEKFGFTYTGHVNISVTSSLASSDSSHLGFFLLSEQALVQVLLELQQNPNAFCVLDSKFISLLFNFHPLSLPSPPASPPLSLYPHHQCRSPTPSSVSENASAGSSTGNATLPSFSGDPILSGQKSKTRKKPMPESELRKKTREREDRMKWTRWVQRVLWTRRV